MTEISINVAAEINGEEPYLDEVVRDLSAIDPKLVYADWLEERGDPRGNYLRQFANALENSSDYPDASCFSPTWLCFIGSSFCARLRDAGLERLRDDALRAAVPIIAIESNPYPSKQSDFAIGASRFGGHPDLPEDVAWPACERGPQGTEGGKLGLLAQINLAEISKMQVARQFPRDGILSFFVYLNEEIELYGRVMDTWRLLYTPGSRTLRRCEVDLDIGYMNYHEPRGLTFTDCIQFPMPEELGLNYGSDDYDAYNEIRDVLSVKFQRVDHELPLVQNHRLIACDTLRHDGGVEERCLAIFSSDRNMGWNWMDGCSLMWTLEREELKAETFHCTQLGVAQDI